MTPEQVAREQIDAMLREAGWAVQNVRQINLSAAKGVAVRELVMKGGAADYALFLGRHLVGIIEAKRVGTTLGGVEAQTRAYASGLPSVGKAPITPATCTACPPRGLACRRSMTRTPRGSRPRKP